ncbi:MAG: type I-U CRISPR-associated helicase/endonuclease Cas3 [Gemmataceae bacterium]
MIEFAKAFAKLTGNPPFPWQRALYERFVADRPDNIPASCNLPTGLGKTSVIAVWLIALANKAAVPRRLVYVVNRRTVVDQTTDEVEKYRYRLHQCEALAEGLLAINSPPPTIPFRPQPLAISTLRGQYADNREWSADPSRPAVICGTVDMIGSRLLFSGYGVGMKGKPLHAGFLGQDALLVHDEAHLEPAFQTLLETIEKEQDRCKDFRPLRVMELTATSRGTTKPFGLTDADRENATVKERVGAAKALRLHELKDAKKLAEQLTALALSFEDKGRAVVVFTRTVDDVMKVAGKLPKGRVVTLTGTMRGKERDDLVEHPVFKRFMPGGQSDEPSVCLVCTSAGEVGVNISGDHLICDLSTFESMAQRFGRVNRFGNRPDTEIHVIHPTDFEDDEYDQRRKKTLALLRELNGDGSPDALGNLDPELRREAFTPDPKTLPATDILFDAWALTTVRDKLPGRPPVEPYLHGLPTDWQPPETHVAWRTEVEKITNDLLKEYEPEDLLDAYPLKPHELLKEPSYRAFKQFEVMAKRLADTPVPVWLVDDDGKVKVTTLKELAEKDNKDRINGMTVLLPPSAGGLDGGMLNGTAPAPEHGSLDVADTADRIRLMAKGGELTAEQKEQAKELHLVRRIDFTPAGDDEDAAGEAWLWFVLRNEGDKSAKKPVLWEVHVRDVAGRTREIVANLPLDGELKNAIITAADFHDHGKRRKLFQRVLGNTNPEVCLAKSGKKGGRVKETYRHEFGSLLDVEKEPAFLVLTADQKELVLHLIAAHHGRARPHFIIDNTKDPPVNEVFDPDNPQHEERIAREVSRRFARLQRKYGRWGLAYLESLLRAADWSASAEPSKFVEGEQ